MTLDFLFIILLVALAMLVWDCLEVGRNDAANLINAVFGARILRRRTAILIAGVAAVLGATAASPVIETARKGIFDPLYLATLDGISPEDALRMAMTIYVSVYIVDTVLLYAYSAFGMPISTTASLIFELIGASFALAGFGIVNWDTAGTVILAIFVSIAFSGIAAFLIQRAFRAAIRDRVEDPQTIYLQGPWVAGAMLTWLSWFMLVKGLKGVPFIAYLKSVTLEEYGAVLFMMTLWFLFYVLIHLFLTITRERGAYWLFRGTALLGMICMAFAFGQNDLANCASPGLATFALWQHNDLEIGTGVSISRYALFFCGLLIMAGMMTRNAQRVTRAAVNTGSQFDQVALWAPRWCLRLARLILRMTSSSKVLAPPPAMDERGKKIHYDTLRASVIMAVSASVIAFASSRGLPVSTTYVAFAAVVATGMADRVFVRGDSELKIGRTIWVFFSWFSSALVAMVASGVVCRALYHLEFFGLIIALSVNIAIRIWAKRRSDIQDLRIHEEARERMGVAHPATGDGTANQAAWDEQTAFDRE